MQNRPDLEAFAHDLNELARELRASSGEEDLRHLSRMKRWGRACTAVGYATAWIGPNPLSVVALSTGRFARWTMVAHHVTHRGYDKIENGPKGTEFAEGWRRWVDWPDWLVPAAWKHEHNQVHHYRLNETADPDLVEHNLGWLRDSPMPLAAKLAIVAFFAATWKFTYYAPSTLAALREPGDPGAVEDTYTWAFDPRTETGRELWMSSYLPYALGHFVAVPAAFGALLGPWAGLSVAANSMMAELLTNLHTFAVIVPNHVGDDLYRFDTRYRGKAEFYFRQVIGSANFRTGGDLNDFLHGFLNYQIEHHLWPDMSMRAYQRAQPHVEEICERHGVPYVQNSVFRRVFKTVRVMVGRETMKVWDEQPAAAVA